MSVNENVYSSRSNWKSYAYDYIKIPSYETILDGAQQGFITKNNELDNSICTVLADKNFSGGYISYIRGNGNNNINEKYVIRDIYGEENRKIYLSAASFYRSALNLINVDELSNSFFAPNEEFDYTKNYSISKTVLTFGDNSNIKLVPYVLCGKNFVEVLSYFIELDEWREKYATTHFLIFGVVCVPFFKNNGTYTPLTGYDSSGYYFGITNGFLNFSSKKYDFYRDTTLIANTEFYKLNRTFSQNYYFKINETANINNSFFPIFLNCDNYDNDLRRLWGTQNNTYTPVVGYFPDVEKVPQNSPFPDYTENGVGIFLAHPYEGTIKTICRFINLTNSYWGESEENRYDNFYEWCKKQTAYFGMFFTTSFNNLQETLDSDKTFLGVIDENGITHGDYVFGLTNKTQNNYSGDIINIEKNDIPIDKIEKDKGDLTTNTYNYSYISGLKYYVLAQQQYPEIIRFLNNDYNPTSEELTIDFKGKNPIEYIVNSLRFPFEIPVENDLQGVTIGKIAAKYNDNSNITAWIMDNHSQLFDFGSITLNKYFDDFRDYEPFTTCEIYLPFCEKIKLDLTKTYNKNISVKYSVDFPTGACTALIFADDLLIATSTGQCGVSLPLSGIEQGNYQNEIMNNSFRLKQSNISTFNSIAKTGFEIMQGDIRGVTSSIFDTAQHLNRFNQSDYNLKHTSPQISTVSTASPQNSFSLDLQPKMIISRTKTPNYNSDIFKNTVGYACLKSGILSDFTGLLVCSNVKLNISSTDTEKEMIKSLLLSGVYN